MIRTIEVEGLNNRVDATMEFNEDLNIITGKNGSGKTTLLKLIWYSISGNLERIIPEILFRSVSIETTAFSLSIHIGSNKGKIQYQLANEDKNGLDFEIPLRRPDVEKIDELNARIVNIITSSLFFPTFRRIEGGFAQVSRSVVDADSVRHGPFRFGRRFRAAEMLQDATEGISTEISVHEHKFIASISTHDIVELLRDKYAEVSEKTNELHAKLSEDITQRISEREPTDDPIPILDGIQKQVEEINKERDSLFRPFSVLSERIRDVFQYEGISLTARIILGEVKEAIESDKLSAGEKQMLSFLSYNIFSENTAIFIDEPELSLHVDWQRLLLPTLLEQATGNQFFIATHSPFIYAKYPEKEILLGENRGGDYYQ